MTILVGIMIGVGICYWLRISAETRQKMVVQNAEIELLKMLAAKHMKDQTEGAE